MTEAAMTLRLQALARGESVEEPPVENAELRLRPLLEFAQALPLTTHDDEVLVVGRYGPALTAGDLRRVLRAARP